MQNYLLFLWAWWERNISRAYLMHYATLPDKPGFVHYLYKVICTVWRALRTWIICPFGRSCCIWACNAKSNFNMKLDVWMWTPVFCCKNGRSVSQEYLIRFTNHFASVLKTVVCIPLIIRHIPVLFSGYFYLCVKLRCMPLLRVLVMGVNVTVPMGSCVR